MQGPTDQEIEDAVRGLPGGRPSYVILSKKKHHFMQAGGGGGPKNGFHFEFEEFSNDGLWEHKDSPDGRVDVETVVKAMISYASDKEDWRELPWVRLSAAESDARQKKLKEEMEVEQPDPGFFKTLASGLFGLALIELGVIDKKKRK